MSWRTGQGVLGVVLVLAIVGVYALTQRRERPWREIDASSAFADDWRGHGPQRAFDGDARTEWHTEDMTAGTLIRRWPSPIRIERVTLINARNPPWLDRATDRYRVELVDAEGAIVATRRGRATPGERVTHELGTGGVSELRFVAETFHGSSAGLAELIIEPPPR